MLITKADIIFCGIGFIFKKDAFVIWPVIESLLINISTLCGVAVSYNHPEASLIEVKVDCTEYSSV